MFGETIEVFESASGGGLFGNRKRNRKRRVLESAAAGSLRARLAKLLDDESLDDAALIRKVKSMLAAKQPMDPETFDLQSLARDLRGGGRTSRRASKPTPVVESRGGASKSTLDETAAALRGRGFASMPAVGGY